MVESRHSHRLRKLRRGQQLRPHCHRTTHCRITSFPHNAHAPLSQFQSIHSTRQDGTTVTGLDPFSSQILYRFGDACAENCEFKYVQSLCSGWAVSGIYVHRVLHSHKHSIDECTDTPTQHQPRADIGILVFTFRNLNHVMPVSLRLASDGIYTQSDESKITRTHRRLGMAVAQ